MPITLSIAIAAGTVPVTVTDCGAGRPILLLHGGAGPASVGAFAGLLAARHPVRVVTPVHPGFDATPRPQWLSGVRDLAATYSSLLDELDLADVTVVGNSLGGWTAAELALLDSPRVGRIVLVDAVGLTDDVEPIVDFFALSADEVVELSYHAAHRGAARDRLAALPDAVLGAMAGNRAALLGYGGTDMADPTLAVRLAAVRVPALVVWGEADRVVSPRHAHRYADAIPGATLEFIADAGHLPQLETPDRLADTVWAFVSR